MTHASVFSGIGGPEVAATMLGWENLFHCEINPFGRQVLDYWYPNSKSYEDITTTDFTEWRGRVDVLTGGFPCQPFSYAGRRRGAEDDRYLWPSMYRAIDEIQPTWVVAENVAGILTMVEQGEVSKVAGTATLFDAFDDLRGRYELRETFTLQRICTDLESHGYAVQPVLVPACAVGAPHRRDRVFIVARRIASDTDNRADRRTAGEDEGKGREERIQERHEVRKPDEPNQVRPESATIPQDSMHSRQLYGQDEVEGSERNIGNVGAGGSERICGETSRTVAADTDCNGHQSQAESGRPETSGRSDNGEPCQRSEPTEWSERFYSLLRNHADTSEQCGSQIEFRQSQTGRKTQGKSGGGSGEDGSWRIAADSNSNRRCEMDEYMEPELADGAKPVSNGRQRNVANTSDIGAGQREQAERKECGRPSLSEFRECYGASLSADGGVCGERWKNFPSVSPVHRGDDGLPFPVDDLTIPFGKWRTESLKAYGNAIVPQVMYEIFRAIEQTEREMQK